MTRLYEVEATLPLRSVLAMFGEGTDEFELYTVYLCGCTDCFPHAMFAEKKEAEKWGEANSHNPEGWFIHTTKIRP